MADAVARWHHEPVPAGILTAAVDVADGDTVRWRLQNLHPEPASVARLCQTYADGRPCERVPPGPTGSRPPAPAGPWDLGRAIRQSVTGDVDVGTGVAADHAFLAGDFGLAARGYGRRAAQDPGDDAAWVGLALSLRRLGDEPAGAMLVRRPDVVRAMVARLRRSGPAAPAAVAAWLANGWDNNDQFAVINRFDSGDDGTGSAGSVSSIGTRGGAFP
jgi:hypothetical protein